jgi:leucoanthocyanidin reductase
MNAENCIPESVVASITHDIFINGCQVNFKIDGIHDVEISTLYPGESVRSLEECYEKFVVMAADKIHKETGVTAGGGGAKALVEPVPITASC